MVFKTIADNVKSFFLKEDALEHEPKKAPDAAVELFEKPASHAIISHNLKGPLPTTEQPKAQPTLPFSAAQLRERLGQQQPPPAFSSEQPVQRPSPAYLPSPRKPTKPLITEEDISSQIAEFEQAISTIPGEDGSRLPLSASAAIPAEQRPLPPSPSPPSGFFAEFERYLHEKGYDVDESLLSEEMLDRMKRHHAQRFSVERHKERGQTLEESLSRKLAELQDLERDWAAKQDEASVVRDRMAQLETEIAERASELKTMVAELRAHSAAAPAEPERLLPTEKRSVPPAQEPSVREPVPAEPSSSPPPQSSPLSPPECLPQNLSVEPAGRPVAPQRELVAPQAPWPVSVPPDLALSSSPSLSLRPTASSARQDPLPRQGLPPEKRFFLRDGRALSSLAELRAALLSMDDQIFYFHVTPERNDFAAWIKGVFQNETLAARAERARNKYELAALVPSP